MAGAILAMIVSENGASVNTQQACAWDMARWYRFAHQFSITQVGPEHHPLFMDFLEKILLAAPSISRNLSAVRHYFYFLSTENSVPHGPWQGLRNPHYPAHLPQPMNVEAIAHLLGHAHGDASPDGTRLSAVLELLYATGMRISELIGLPLFQLADDAAPSLLIRGKGGHEGFFHPSSQSCIGPI